MQSTANGPRSHPHRSSRRTGPSPVTKHMDSGLTTETCDFIQSSSFSAPSLGPAWGWVSVGEEGGISVFSSVVPPTQQGMRPQVLLLALGSLLGLTGVPWADPFLPHRRCSGGSLLCGPHTGAQASLVCLTTWAPLPTPSPRLQVEKSWGCRTGATWVNGAPLSS